MIDSARTFTFDRFVTPAGQAADLSPIAPAAAPGAGDDGSPAADTPEAEKGSVVQVPTEDAGVSQSRAPQADAPEASEQAREAAPATAPVAGMAPASSMAADPVSLAEDREAAQPKETGGREAGPSDTAAPSRMETAVVEDAGESAPVAETRAVEPTAGVQPVQDQLADAHSVSVGIDLSQSVQLPDGPDVLPDLELNSNPAVGVDLAAEVEVDLASPIEDIDLSDPLMEMPALEIVSAPAHLATSAPVATVDEEVAQLLDAVAIASPVEDVAPDIGPVAPLDAPELGDVSHTVDAISTPPVLDDLDIGGLGL